MELTYFAEQRLYAYTGGRAWDPTLPCVVFIHGALNDHSVWGLAARWCAHHGHSVLALDLPGHGRSPGPALGTVETMAQAVLSALAHAGVQRASLVGHSMGSLIALQAAAMAHTQAHSPDGTTGAPWQGHIDRLVMVGTAYPMKVSAALLHTAATEPLQAIDQVVQFSHASALASKPSYPGPGSWLPGGSRALMRQVLARAPADPAPGSPNLFHLDFQACDQYRGGEAAVQALQSTPRLRRHFILGARDRMTAPRQAQTLAQALQARVHTLANAGHALMQDDPDGFLAALRLALADPVDASVPVSAG